MQNFDVAIIGSSITGLTLACGLHKAQISIAVITSNDLQPVSIIEKPSLQIADINIASRYLLQYIKIWDTISSYVSPYLQIEVREKDSFGSTILDGSSLGYREFGYIIDNAVIHTALWNRAKQLDKISLIFSTSLREVHLGKRKALITLSNGQALTARLIVVADSSCSWLRTKANIPINFWDYQYYALVGVVRTSEPHASTVRYTFYEDGVLSFFPLTDSHLNFIVWLLPPIIAKERLTMLIDKFNSYLSIYSSLSLGRCELQSERKIIPLAGRYARNFSSHRLALVGDIAHTVHLLPVQAINSELMDVTTLLSEVVCLHKVGRDIGRSCYLKRYEKNRRHSATLTLASMQGLCNIISGQQPLKKWIRGSSLWLIDKLPFVKSQLIKRKMGLNNLPDWLIYH